MEKFGTKGKCNLMVGEVSVKVGRVNGFKRGDRLGESHVSSGKILVTYFSSGAKPYFPAPAPEDVMPGSNYPVTSPSHRYPSILERCIPHEK